MASGERVGQRQSAPGVMTISIDFELAWGVFDSRGVAAYESNLRGVPAAIEQTLALFDRYRIHATWAAVGLLFCGDRNEALAAAPDLKPAYEDPRCSAYGYLAHADDLDPALHFAPNWIDRIRQHAGQEIGSHSFAHYYALEPGQDAQSFRADVQAAIELAHRRGIVLQSFVFPRNQSNPAYLPMLRDAGFLSFRGNERGSLYRAGNGQTQSRWRRLGRLIDSYINLSGHHTVDPARLAGPPPLDLPASRFLRPVSRSLAWLEPLRLRRITRALDAAAQRGHAFHLWWHPHNFGVDTDANLQFLERVLQHFDRLRNRYAMRSMNMAELARAVRSTVSVSDVEPVRGATVM